MARATNQTHLTHHLVKMFQLAFQHYSYIVTEYKPTLGTVFADYLKGYTHWSYTDIDLMVSRSDLITSVEMRTMAVTDYGCD